MRHNRAGRCVDPDWGHDLPGPFDLAGRYFWALAIGMSFLNAAILKARSVRHVERDPALQPGYDTLIRGYLTWMNIPWVVMGLGVLVGGVPSVWQFFQPRDGNPFVLAWFASVFALWVVSADWIFRRGGAELIATHPGVLSYNVSSSCVVKFFWVMCLIGGVAGFTMMWTQKIPLPMP
jgi:hypothetical protein